MGVGKTGAAIRAADPTAKDLDKLKELLAGMSWTKELPRILACLQLHVRIPDLCQAAKESNLSFPAVAM